MIGIINAKPSQNSNGESSAKLIPLPEPNAPTAAPYYIYTTSIILPEKQKAIPILIPNATSETKIAPPERKSPIIIAPVEDPAN